LTGGGAREAAEDYRRFWIQESRALATRSSQGTFRLAGESSHRLHTEAPDLVLETILAVRAGVLDNP
jgi:hypothetical protein